MKLNCHKIDKLKCFALVYLATPYSKFPGGREAAWIEAVKLTGELMKSGVKIYSPIAHGHPAAVASNLDQLDHDFWLDFDAAMMRKADAICVAELPSWETSFGVSREIKTFIEARKPVIYLDVQTVH